MIRGQPAVAVIDLITCKNLKQFTILIITRSYNLEFSAAPLSVTGSTSFPNFKEKMT